jgi:hypothetical protein
LRRAAKAGVLAHGPKPAAIHVGINAAGEREFAGLTEVRGGSVDTRRITARVDDVERDARLCRGTRMIEASLDGGVYGSRWQSLGSWSGHDLEWFCLLYAASRFERRQTKQH